MTCFSQPRYPGEIQELLNSIGRTTQPSQLLLKNKNSRLTKLIEKEWLEKLNEEQNQEIIKNIKDKRAKKRHYFISTLEPIINYIDSQVPLQKNERRQLKHLFEKKAFKSMFQFELGFHNFKTVKEFLFLLTFWTYTSNKYTAPYKTKMKNESDTSKKNRFSELSTQLMKKRNKIAERTFPELKLDLPTNTYNELYPFVQDSNLKLVPPLIEKLMQLSDNRILFFEMALDLLACGEFMEQYQQSKNK